MIPKEIRARLHLREGDDLVVECSPLGEINLRPVRRRGKGLVKALRALKGLELKRFDEPIRFLRL